MILGILINLQIRWFPNHWWYPNMIQQSDQLSNRVAITRNDVQIDSGTFIFFKFSFY